MMNRLQCLGDQQLADPTEEASFATVIGWHQLQQLTERLNGEAEPEGFQLRDCS
jgi:hypothetical protein